MVSRAPGAAQSPKIVDFRPAQKSCIKNQSVRFGAMDVTKPSKFAGFGAMDVTKPYKFTGFGAMDVTKSYKFA